MNSSLRFMMIGAVFFATSSHAQSDLDNLAKALHETALAYCKAELQRLPNSDCVRRMRSLLEVNPLQSIIDKLTAKERIEINFACGYGLAQQGREWLEKKFEALYGVRAAIQKKIADDSMCQMQRQYPSLGQPDAKRCEDPTRGFHRHEELRQLEERYGVTKEDYFERHLIGVKPHPNAYIDCVAETARPMLALRDLETLQPIPAPKRPSEARPSAPQPRSAPTLSAKRWVAAPTIATVGRPPNRLPADELFTIASPSVYLLVGGDRGSAGDLKLERQGSAVAISERFALTNCHVIRSHQSSFFLLQEGNNNPIPVRIAAADPDSDRCVIEVSSYKLRPVRGVRSYESLTVGEALFAVGNPLGLSSSLTDGLLSGKRRNGKMRFVQTNVAISPGSSGGGLFDAVGNLVAITTAALKDAQNVNVAIPAEDFLALRK